MGIFSTECAACGSKDHATSDCPHGIFSTECAACGSKNHATSDCPHGMFSTECAACGSKDHATSDCPHGIFSTECAACGSKNHATSDCPHGIFSTECAACGSKNHATSDCPHGIFSSRSSNESNNLTRGETTQGNSSDSEESHYTSGGDYSSSSSPSSGIGFDFLVGLFCIPIAYGAMWVTEHNPAFSAIWWLAVIIGVPAALYAIRSMLTIAAIIGILYLIFLALGHILKTETSTEQSQTVNALPSNAANTIKDTLFVISEQLNVRSGPGPEYNPPITRLSLGDSVTILESAQSRDGGTWVKIQANSIEGWVNEKLLSKKSPSLNSHQLKNIYSLAEYASDGYAILKEKGVMYQITYSGLSHGDTFWIHLPLVPDNQESIAKWDFKRSQAEADFLKILQVSKAEACQLNVKVGFAGVHDDTLAELYAGKNFGLSFCQNSENIPPLP
jgi:SH3-like domain-containing protein